MKKIILSFFVISILFSFGKFKADNQKINQSKEEISEILNRNLNKKNAANLSDDEIAEEDIQMFTEALNNVKTDLSNYLDITGLNVTDKESITIPDYNPNYIVPTFSDAISEVHNDMIESFNDEELDYYENYRKNHYDFDKYATIAEDKFRDITIRPKYLHKNYVKPAYNPNSVHNRMNNLLISVGLASAACYVLLGCADTLIATAPIAWFYPVSVPVATAALAGIVTVILLNWDLICSIFNELVSLFVECLARLGTLIVEFFTWVRSQVTESSTAGTLTIDNQTFTFTEVRTDDVATTVSIATHARRTKDVFLMQYVKSKSFQIAFGTPVTMDFCIKNKTHLSGFSSYTWYQNNARNLILKAGTGYTSAIPELHLYDGNNNSPQFAFKHFHNYTSAGLRDESGLAKRSHSFFGLLYYSPNNDGVGEVHPNSPKN